MNKRKSVGLTALVVGTLCLSACTPPGIDADNTGNTGTNSTPPRSQQSAARPISVQQYATTLAGAVRPLDSAYKALNKAKGYKGLSGRVTDVRDATQRAVVALEEVTPPPGIAADHARLVAALRGSYSELDGTDTKVGSRDVCTGPAVRADIGDAGATRELRTALEATTAKLPGERVSLSLPSAGQKVGSRPANGSLVRSGSRNGRGTLTVDNDGGSSDTVVTLRKGSKTAFSVYVRSGKKTTVRGISDGTYSVYFTSGDHWDRKTRAFASDCQFEKFDESFRYSTRSTATRIEWTTWTLELQSSLLGNAPTSDVDPDDFPEG